MTFGLKVKSAPGTRQDAESIENGRIIGQPTCGRFSKIDMAVELSSITLAGWFSPALCEQASVC